jgi:hypothetical protein
MPDRPQERVCPKIAHHAVWMGRKMSNRLPKFMAGNS